MVHSSILSSEHECYQANVKVNQGKENWKGSDPEWVSALGTKRCEPSESRETQSNSDISLAMVTDGMLKKTLLLLHHMLWPHSVTTPAMFTDPREAFIANSSQDHYFLLHVSQLCFASIGDKGQWILGPLLSAGKKTIYFQVDLTIFLALVYLSTFFFYILFCCIFMVPEIKPKTLRRLSRCSSVGRCWSFGFQLPRPKESLRNYLY